MGLFDGIIDYITYIPSATYDSSKDIYNLGKNASDYLNSASYKTLLDQLNTITGGVDYNTFVKGVSDIPTMTKLSDLQKSAMEGYSDYRSNQAFGDGFLSNILDSADLYSYNMGTRLEPIGTYNGTNVYPELSPLLVGPTGSYFLDSDTSNLKQVQDTRGNNPVSAGMSVLSGGLSDVITGSAPGSGLSYVGQDLPALTSIMNPGLVSGYKAGQGIEANNAAGWGQAIEAFVDPVTDPGITEVAELLGNGVKSINPEIVPYLDQIGAVVGGVAAGGLPGGAIWGPVAGGAFGSKMEGEDADERIIKGAINAGASYASQGIAAPVSKAVSPYIGDAAGKVVGGVTQGAAKGAMTGAKSAYDTGSITPVVVGAGIGGLAGGVSSAYDVLNTPKELTPEEQFYVDKMKGVVSEGVTGEQAITPQVAYEQGLEGLSHYLGQELPQFKVDPELLTPLFNPITDYTMGGADKTPEFKGSVVEGTKSPEFGEGYTGAFYANGQLTFPPSFIDRLGDYAGKVGEVVSNNSGAIKNLAQILAQVGTPTVDSGKTEDAPKGRAAEEQAWLSEILKGGTGIGKSKGLEAGYAEGPGYDSLFYAPNKKIKGYLNTGLYE